MPRMRRLAHARARARQTRCMWCGAEDATPFERATLWETDEQTGAHTRKWDNECSVLRCINERLDPSTQVRLRPPAVPIVYTRAQPAGGPLSRAYGLWRLSCAASFGVDGLRSAACSGSGGSVRLLRFVARSVLPGLLCLAGACALSSSVALQIYALWDRLCYAHNFTALFGDASSGWQHRQMARMGMRVVTLRVHSGPYKGRWWPRNHEKVSARSQRWGCSPPSLGINDLSLRLGRLPCS